MKGESSLIAEYVLEMALLLGTDGLKINVCTCSKEFYMIFLLLFNVGRCYQRNVH